MISGRLGHSSESVFGACTVALHTVSDYWSTKYTPEHGILGVREGVILLDLNAKMKNPQKKKPKKKKKKLCPRHAKICDDDCDD